ncbi:MAG: hypothetical protein BroJett003_01740 [Planctomycetota bacterium]|nr:MAG: hypothetical protein BroJett003_01740 [Planctomycetota bacterium]
MFGLFRNKQKLKTAKHAAAWNMDAAVLKLSNNEFISLLWAMAGLFIAGMTGSSKSTSSAKQAARALLRLGCGGLILTVKNERAMWEKLCKEEGRLDDLVIFNPQNPWRFDPILHETERKGPGAGMTEVIVELLMTLVEFTSRDRNQGSRENEAYWRNSCMRLLRSATDLLLLAGRRVTVRDLYRVVISAPQSLADVVSEQWRRSSFCYECLAEADKRPRTASQTADYEIVADFFLAEFPGTSDKTRSITVSQFTSTCDVLLRGTLREMFAGGTNITPEATEEGRIILVDMPLKTWGAVGLCANLLWKTAFQRSIERRDVRVSPRPVFLFADEGHYYLHRDDSLFQTTCRSSRCASILVTQNIANLDAALGTGDAGRAEAESLLANFGTLIFHCNTCQRTNALASQLCGEQRVLMASGNSTYDADSQWSGVLGLDWLGHSGSTSAGFSEQYRPILEAAAFTRLRAGGKVNGFEADVIVVKSGDLFRSTGTTWLPVTFRQDF